MEENKIKPESLTIYENLKAELRNYNDVKDKIVFLVKSGDFMDSSKEEERRVIIQLCESNSPYYDEGLYTEIKNMFESSSAQQLDEFFVELKNRIFADSQDEYTRNEIIGHWVIKVISMPFRHYVRELPTDSSALDIWYTLAKHMLYCTVFYFPLLRVYKKNKDDPRSKKFYGDFVRGKDQYINVDDFNT